MKQPHLRVGKKDVNKYCLLPGDPGRVLRIAKHLKNAKKISDYRGYLVYNGDYKGVPVTVCSTGMGGPSIAIAIHELVKCGAQVLIRVGSSGALQKGMKEGELIIPSSCVREDGVSRLYADKSTPAYPNKKVLKALVKSAEGLGVKYHEGVTRSHDGFYQPDNDKVEQFWSRVGLLGSDFETSPLFIISRLLKVKTGSILNIVSEFHVEEPEGGITDYVEQISSRKGPAYEGERNSIMVALSAIKKLRDK
ncbi:nucleoside phosphorylase|nr:nucleoside phosphorylase [archaeon]